VKAFFLSLAIAALTLLGLAALRFNAAGFDYLTASETRQQVYLDRVASQIRSSFSSGGAAEVTGLSVEAPRDAIVVSLRYTDPATEEPPAQQIQFLKKYMYTENCGRRAVRAVIERGVKLEIRFTRPSGRPLAEVTLDRRACAGHGLHAESGE